MTLFYYIFFIVAGYLSGSILWSKIIAKLFFSCDIVSENPDGNPGASNVFKSCGVAGGIAALLLDLAKGFLPVYFSLFFVDPKSFLFSLIIAAPVIGHIFPVFNRFRGGKAIAASFGSLLGLSFLDWRPLILLAGLYIFFSVVAVVRPHIWRSVVVFVLFGFFSAFFVSSIHITVGCVMISVAIFLRHYISRDKNEPFSVSFFYIPKKKEKE